ncbi:MAG: BamA/TamA family outer membrane protein [Bacteroidota bacterium]
MAQGVQAYQDTQPDSTAFKSDSVKDRNGRLLVLPVITFSPETSLRLGAIGVYYFRFKGSSPQTQLSTIKFPITYTLENQAKIRFSYEIFFRENSHILKGFAEWVRFPFQFYGIGADTEDEDEEIYTSRMIAFNFNYFKQFEGNIFAGFRFIRTDSRIVEREPDGLLAQEGLIPGNNGGIVTGVGLLGRIDKRDNNFNATRGIFIETALTTYQPWLGSDFEFTKLEFDFRKFFYPLKKHVFAIQGVFEHNWGTPSFETLALLGGDEINRGHFEGRFRDNSLWAAQAEYRLPIGRSNWIDERDKIPFKERWGIVGFAGFGSVSPDITNPEFGEVKTALGFGVRYLALPKERINVRLDFGFGTQRPGFYFNIREAF